MSEEATTCPSCGETSRDAEWCDNCGARLTSGTEERDPWLKEGDRARLLTADEKQLVVEARSAVDTFATRRVWYAKVAEGPEALVDSRVMLEETESLEEYEGRIPKSLEYLFRTPLATGRNGDHELRAYEDTGAVTVEDLVDLNGGAVSYQQVKESFCAIVDAVKAAHEAKHLVLAIAPWTIRLENARTPDDSSAETISAFQDGDITVENRLPDKAALDAAADAAEAEIERERSEASELSEASSEPEEDEEKHPTSDAEDEGLSDDDAESAEEDVVEPVEEEEDGLSGRTMPSHVAASSGEFPVDPEPTLEGNAFSGFDDVSDVDDGWDELDEDGPLSETGILTVAQMAPDPEISAYFEGVDELFPFDEEPYEVPVIMGFSPPELLGRVRAELGPHCDVFALGMLLYYMIAGRVPPASVYTRYSPALPARNFRPGFPPGLQSVISRATRPTPSERFASV